MPQYFIAYLGGNQPATPEAAKAHFSAYMQWIASLGDAVINPANPFQNTHMVYPDGNAIAGGVTTMSGFTVIAADSIEIALKIARSCPFLAIGGSLEVSEMMQMQNIPSSDE